MKKVIAVLLTIVLILGLSACGETVTKEEHLKKRTNAHNLYLDSRILWGMPQNEVSGIESKLNIREDRNLLEYRTYIKLAKSAPSWPIYDGWFEGETEEVPIKISYIFTGDSISNNELGAYYCAFESWQELSQYKTVKNILTAEYGECSTEEIIWNDEFYKDDESKWDIAFENGNVSILASWILEDYGTIMFLEWDDTVGCSIKYFGMEYVSRL